MFPHMGVGTADAGTGQPAQFAADSSPAVRAERAAAPTVAAVPKAPDPGILQVAPHMLESLEAAAGLRGISSRPIPSNNTFNLEEKQKRMGRTSYCIGAGRCSYT
jgi:hypothetical protein